MNLDDESHLSAYLDDELDPADRLAIEWSIESSSRRADQLRSIVLARDAVANLDRPSIPRDLSSSIRTQIASNRSRTRFGPPARVALVFSSFAGFSAIAASLIFALIGLYTSLHPTPEIPVVALQSEEAKPSQPIDLIIPSLVEDVPTSRPDPPVSTDREPKFPAVAVAAVPPADGGEPEDKRVIGGILGRSHIRRIVIVTDVIDAADRVKDLIARNGRETPEFGRITVAQEIIIDPDHPEAAEVFAVPIDERGRRSFIDRLKASFPDLIEEGRSKTELLTQLSEVGQVAVFRGLKAAPLGDPPRDLPEFIANREREGDPFILEANRLPAPPSRSDGVSPAGRPGSSKAQVVAGASPSGTDAEFVGPPDLDRKAPPRPGERVSLLVWVTRPSRHRD